MADRSYSKVDDFDTPPMSRLFVICNKTHSEDEIRGSFEKYGPVEDVWMVKDKNTGENKGVAYVKFAKTSQAALAQEELNSKCIGHSDRPIKVLVAASRHEGSKKHIEDEHDRYVRLFLVVSKDATSDDLREEFEKYGDIESVQIVRDKITRESKGVAYVRFQRFYHAAIAYEKCPSKYKAVFANPKSSRHSSDNASNSTSRSENGSSSFQSPPQLQNNEMSKFHTLQNLFTQPTALNVVCSNQVNQDQLWRLFDIVPGLDYCQITGESGPNCSAATVVYTNKDSAHYAKDKIHGLEYPPGNRLIVKFADGVSKSSGGSPFGSLCNVEIPPPQPMVDPKSEMAKRCFIVLNSSLPSAILKHVFSAFGNLMEVYTLPNKNCGYAKYASRDSANRAIDTLNGAEICGVSIKVMEAEERHSSRKRMHED